jgi:hypothetical protein
MPGTTRASLNCYDNVTFGGAFSLEESMNTVAKIKKCAQALAEATEDFSDEEAMAILKMARRIRRQKSGDKRVQNN